MAQPAVADKIADYINRENQRDNLWPNQKVRCIEIFLQYLRYQHSQLTSAYPAFGDEHTGSSFVIQQIDSALSRFRNPGLRGWAQPNLLDDEWPPGVVPG